MQRVTLLALLVALPTLMGCSSITGDDAEEAAVQTAISRVSTAITVANTQEAGRHAASGEYETADRLVSESLVNVQLAAAKADAARVQAEVERIGGSAVPGSERSMGDTATQPDGRRQ